MMIFGLDYNKNDLDLDLKSYIWSKFQYTVFEIFSDIYVALLSDRIQYKYNN